MHPKRIVVVSLVLLFLTSGVASADTTVGLPSPCNGSMTAETPFYDSGSEGVTGVGDFHCANYQNGWPDKVGLWYFYTSTGSWGQAISFSESMYGYDDSIAVTKCASYDATSHYWKTRVNWGGGYATENVALLHYKKTC